MKRNFQPKENFQVLRKSVPFYTGGKIQFTRDDRILSLCHDKLKTYNICSGETEDAVDSDDEVASFLLADDGTTLVIADKSGVMKLYNFESKSILKTWKSLHPRPVSCMAFDSTTTLLATASSDSSVFVYDIIHKYYTHHFKGGVGVFSKICFLQLKSELHVVGTSDDYIIHVWNLRSRRLIQSLQGHCSTVTDIVFHEKNNFLLSSGRDKVILVWDMSCLQLAKTIPVNESIEMCILAPDSLQLNGLCLNPEGIYVITAGSRGILKVWDINLSRCVYVQFESAIVPAKNFPEDSLLITQGFLVPHLKCIVVTTFEQNILFFSYTNFVLKNQFVGYNDDILAIKFWGESDSHIAVATNSNQIKVFDFSSFSCQFLIGHEDIVLDLCVFPKHKNVLVSGSKDNSVKVWGMSSGSKHRVKCLYTGFSHTDSVTAIACSRGTTMFFASGSKDTTLKLWELPEIKLSMNVNLLLVPYCTVKAHDKIINSVDVSLNGALVASASQDHTAKIWNSKDLSLAGTLRGHKKSVWCVTFSSVDMVVATSSGDHTIRIWSLVNFVTLSILDGHEATVLQAYFLSRGTQLISSASDGVMKLWDIRHSVLIKDFEGHSGKVWTLAHSDSEEFVVSGGSDSNIIIWKDVTSLEKEKKMEENENYVIESQNLSNLVHAKQWLEALGLAIALDKPFLAYKAIEGLLNQAEDSLSLEDVFLSLRQDQKETLLKYCVEWATNNKTCVAAFELLTFFQKSCDFTDLLKMALMSSFVRDTLPYLERHFKRTNQSSQDLQLVNFLQSQIKHVGNKRHIYETQEESQLDNDAKKSRSETVTP